VAESLRTLQVTFFYDQFEQVELWGKDLYVHLDEVYRKKARYCVMFISEHYARKLWTSHERRSAQARAFADYGEYILPARFDDTEIPGILPTVGFLSLKDKTPEDFAQLIKVKVEGKARVATNPLTQYRRIAYEGFDCGNLSQKDKKKRFGSVWLIGRKGQWSGNIADGVYQVSNLRGPDASLTNHIRYCEPADQAVELGNCRTSVRVCVKPPSDGHSGAGLLIRADDKGANYYAFLLHPGGSVSLAETRSGKLRFRWSCEIPAISPGAFVTLKAVGCAQTIMLYVNEKLVHTMNDSELLSGNPGTMALSIGQFAFDDFSIYLPQTRDS